jgi:hypothetical protein
MAVGRQAAGKTIARYPAALAAASIVMMALLVVPTAAQAQGTTTSQLTIDTQTTNESAIPGSAISGYYIILEQGGAIVATGFTPYTFTVNDGQTYTVQVDGYRACHFDYWSDSGSASQTVSISNDTTYTAFMSCARGGVQSDIDVQTFNQNGDYLSGYHTTFLLNSQVVGSCFSWCSLSVSNGATYQVAVSNYGDCTFSHWGDGNTDKYDDVNFTAEGLSSTSVQIDAYYDCIVGGNGVSSSVNVYTFHSNGTQLPGMYTTFWQNGQLLKSCFSPCGYAFSNDVAYQVQVANYGPEAFNHWQDNSTSRAYTVDVTGTTSQVVTLGAYYAPGCTTYVSAAPDSFDLQASASEPGYVCVKYDYYDHASTTTFDPATSGLVISERADTEFVTQNFTITAEPSSIVMGGPLNLNEGVTVMYGIAPQAGTTGKYDVTLVGALAMTPSPEYCASSFTISIGTGIPNHSTDPGAADCVIFPTDGVLISTMVGATNSTG